ncbi:hypothetical protein PHSY_004897 [Pseudozyma hubeiensis SY62]|uniref:Matrin-type domain-containing protein n=1 Tax=Pseudozyma hubeiensis (strain SY62) TaxID=1305764 RepID=R9P7U3_PSEHS|nr:hypothetical protein PHSY_004897 [Pseudozyma hubeiensis SY62]GAC97312.1 hypothetical protein PHSY_004897 [Pseudozyma hubeiensis SY62]
MADVWISRKRWTCKYCDVTINDDLPSRRHHETGGRHKQNVRKALEDLYRKGEQERKDAEHTKKEMARIEALAAESYARDQATTGEGAASSSRSTASTSASLPATTVHPKAQPVLAHPARHNTRPSSATGTTDVSRHVAQPGEWEHVLPVASASTSYANEVTDRDRARSFRIKEKVVRLDDSDDDQDLASIKVKKRPRAAQGDSSGLQRGVKKEEQDQLADQVTKDAAVAVNASSELSTTATAATTVKGEESDDVKTGIAPIIDPNDESAGGGGNMFKKRRAGAGAGAKRVRAVI